MNSIGETKRLAKRELLWCVEEQSLSHDYHRYGNLGDRANEKRSGPV